MRIKTLATAFATMLAVAAVIPIEAAADRRDYDRHEPDRHERNRHEPDYGHHVKKLPSRHREIRVSGRPYYYADGYYYRPQSSGYILVGAPIGARVHHLPAGFVSFGFGRDRYFYSNTTYYLWNDRSREYIVVEKPAGADAALVANTEVARSAELFVYPRLGQTEDQRDQDRYECHRWAKDQTGFDPSLSGQDTGLAPDYRRAMSACLEGRGYTVK